MDVQLPTSEVSASKVDAYGEDLEKVLAFAEELSRRLEYQSTRERTFVATAFTLASSVAGLVVGAQLTGLVQADLLRDYRTVTMVLTTFGGALLGGGYSIGFQFVRARQQTRQDRRALKELTELLRSLEERLAVDDAWTALKRAEIRLRIARISPYI